VFLAFTVAAAGTKDEGVRAGTTVERLATLTPEFNDWA